MSDAKFQAAQTAMEKLLNFRLPPQRNLLIFNLRKTASERLVRLPLWTGLTDDQVQFVAEKVIEFIRHTK